MIAVANLAEADKLIDFASGLRYLMDINGFERHFDKYLCEAHAAQVLMRGP